MHLNIAFENSLRVAVIENIFRRVYYFKKILENKNVFA